MNENDKWLILDTEPLKRLYGTIQEGDEVWGGDAIGFWSPTAAKPRGVLFTGAMVRALLAGTKTQTRRLITRANSLVDGSACSKDFWAKLRFDSPEAYVDNGPSPTGNPGPYLHVPSIDGETIHRVYPRVQVGDQWYVKETHAITDESINCQPGYVYRATDPDWSTMEGFKWKPSIFMPFVASRVHLEVTQVRIQRLQEISGKDSLAEGISIPRCGCEVCAHTSQMCPADESAAIMAYAELWDSINKAVPWASNPWCFAYSFKRIE